VVSVHSGLGLWLWARDEEEQHGRGHMVEQSCSPHGGQEEGWGMGGWGVGTGTKYTYLLFWWYRSLHLLGKSTAIWVAHPQPFVLLGYCYYFSTGTHVFTWTSLDHNPFTYAFHVAGMAGGHPHAQIICWDGVSLTFCPDWLQVSILYYPPNLCVPGSWVTGVSHWTWPKYIL
jgi:hypothetical protein